MNHRLNALGIIADAPISLRDFSNCYPHLCYKKCGMLLSKMAYEGLIRRLAKGVYGAVNV